MGFDEDVQMYLKLLDESYQEHHVKLDHKDCRDIKETIELLLRQIESRDMTIKTMHEQMAVILKEFPAV